MRRTAYAILGAGGTRETVSLELGNLTRAGRILNDAAFFILPPH